MFTIRRLWLPLLVAALVAVLIGPSTVTAAEPRAVTGKLMIPAASFIPNSDGVDYDNSGYYLSLGSGSGSFTAPLVFPVQTVRIKKITLYAYDNGMGNVYAGLYRASPPGGDEINLGSVITVDSSADPQTASTTVVNPRQVNTAVAAPYLWVTLTAPGSLRLYGMAVLYSYQS